MLSWLRALLRPPVFEDRDKTRVAALLYPLLWTYALVVLVGTSVAYLARPGSLPMVGGVPLASWSALLVVALVSLLWLTKRGSVRFAAAVPTVGIWLVATSWVWVTGGITDNRVTYLYALVVVFSGLMLSRGATVALAILSVAGILAGYAAEQSGRIVPTFALTGFTGAGMMVVVVLTLALLVYAGRRGLAETLEEVRQRAIAQDRTNLQLRRLQEDLETRDRQRTLEMDHRETLLRATLAVGQAIAANAVAPAAPGSAKVRDPDRLVLEAATSAVDAFGFSRVAIYETMPGRSSGAEGERIVLSAVAGSLHGYPDVGLEIGLMGVATEPAATHGAESARVATATASAAIAGIVIESVRAQAIRIGFGPDGSQPPHGIQKALLAEAPVEAPMTQVEVALPLVVAGQSIGALDVHLESTADFDADDLVVWQVVADQLALALESTRRLSQSREALEEERRFFEQASRRGWTRLLAEERITGYRYRNGQVEPLTLATGSVVRSTQRPRPGVGPRRAPSPTPEDMDAALLADTRIVRDEDEETGASSTAVLPLRARDHVIGVLHIRKRAGAGVWSAGELQLLETLASQLEAALESARLFQDAQRTAAQQQAIAEVSASIREEVEIESVLARALGELGDVLSAEEGSVYVAFDDAAAAADAVAGADAVAVVTAVADEAPDASVERTLGDAPHGRLDQASRGAPPLGGAASEAGRSSGDVAGEVTT